jgi:peptidoglycan/xylan/chitin deacetylase (PgdA/CDA1 family)
MLRKTAGFSLRLLPHVRNAVEKGLTIFVFHEVSDHPSLFARQYDIAISIETFRRQAIWIKTNFNVINPNTLLDGEALPERAALITFDDGFLGTFDHGLPILESLGLPSIIFLNMQAILEGRPTLSALACYLDRHEPKFADFVAASELKPPYHLTLTPDLLERFENRHGVVDLNAVRAYQGAFADIERVRAWDGKDLVYFGNHLFDHWNACALEPSEFLAQYQLNERALAQLQNAVNIFAFTNGQPESCFSRRDLILLKDIGAAKVFAAAAGVNRESQKYLLGRLSFFERDQHENMLWFRVGQAAMDRRLDRYEL